MTAPAGSGGTVLDVAIGWYEGEIDTVTVTSPDVPDWRAIAERGLDMVTDEVRATIRRAGHEPPSLSPARSSDGRELYLCG